MTELIWQGKYDKENRKTAPVRIALPFQTIETVNESAQERCAGGCAKGYHPLEPVD